MNEQNKSDEKPMQNLSELITNDPPPPELTAHIPPAPKNPKPVVFEILGNGVTEITQDQLLDPPKTIPASDPAPATPNNTGAQASATALGGAGANTIPEPPKRGRGRPMGSKTSRAPDFSDVSSLQQVQVDYQLLAGSLFDMSTGTASMIFGPEWQARSPEERQMVINALKVYLEHKEVKDIPPGLMLTVVLLAYSAPRLRAPATSEKLRFGWTWMKMKVVPFFRRKRPLEVVAAKP